MATVCIPSLLRDLTGGSAAVVVAGTTLRQVIEELDAKYPGLQNRLCQDQALRPGIAVAVDGQIATLGLLQPVGPASEVHFLPAVAGGCANEGSGDVAAELEKR